MILTYLLCNLSQTDLDGNASKTDESVKKTLRTVRTSRRKAFPEPSDSDADDTQVTRKYSI